MTKRVLQFTVLLSMLLCVSVQAAPILQLDPLGGAIFGTAGSTIGWGFTLTNDTDYLVVTSADFTPATPLGTFTDFISAFNYILVGPSPESITVSQTFDALIHTGIGSFAIDPGALPGSVANGSIVLTYDLFSVSPNDPNFDSDSDTLNPTSRLLTADASVTMTASAVPEPATMLLLGSGIVGLAGYGKRKFFKK